MFDGYLVDIAGRCGNEPTAVVATTSTTLSRPAAQPLVPRQRVSRFQAPTRLAPLATVAAPQLAAVVPSSTSPQLLGCLSLHDIATQTMTYCEAFLAACHHRHHKTMSSLRPSCTRQHPHCSRVHHLPSANHQATPPGSGLVHPSQHQHRRQHRRQRNGTSTASSLMPPPPQLQRDAPSSPSALLPLRST